MTDSASICGMKRPVEIVKNENSIDLLVVWPVHNLCNFSCSYCPDFNSCGSEKWLTKDMAIRFVDRLYEHCVQKLGYKRIQFSLTGGEPFLWKPLNEFCHYLDTLGVTVGVTSNGNIPLHLVTDVAPLLEWLCVSYHPEFAENERMLAVLDHFQSRGDTVLPSLRLMMHSRPDYWRRSLHFAETVKERYANWSMEFVRVENDFGKGIQPVYYDSDQEKFLQQAKYTESVGDWSLIKKSIHFNIRDIVYSNGHKEKMRPNDLINQDLVNFYGWDCHIGLELLNIHHSGEIVRGGCGVGGSVGWVQRPDEIKLPTKPVVCNRQRCWCGSELLVSKYSPESKRPSLVNVRLKDDRTAHPL